MSKPPLSVVGVYRFTPPPGMAEALAKVRYGWRPADGWTEDYQSILDQLGSIALIELLFDLRPRELDLCDITQADPSLPRGSWQSPWQEAYLSGDGSQLLSRWDEPEVWQRPMRVVFYMHFWRPSEPLLYRETKLPTPEVSPMPKRLSSLHPYAPVD